MDCAAACGCNQRGAAQEGRFPEAIVIIDRPPSFSRTGLFLSAFVVGMILFAGLYRWFSR
jgi:hypothetical protein